MPDIDVSVVVPLYNEEESINFLYDSITNVMKGLNRRYEIIFVVSIALGSPLRIGLLYQKNYLITEHIQQRLLKD
jgi:hypothetical protein